jgi:hypothetical protein
MTATKGSCDPVLISRFFDQELDQEEQEQVAGHLETCQTCRRVLEDLQGLSGLIHDHIQDISSEIRKGEIEEGVLALRQKRNTSWRNKTGKLFIRKKIWIPLTTTAVLILFLAVFFRSSGPTGPSAIVTSLSSETVSVIIMETPQTHQTILWYKEDLDPERRNL